MPDATQPVAGTLSATVRRACQRTDCHYFQRTDCPDHARTEELGVVASFDYRKEPPAHG